LGIGSFGVPMRSTRGRHRVWRDATTSMRTALVLDTIEQAIWSRRRDGVTDLAGLTHHHRDAGSQYASIAFTERLPQPESTLRSERAATPCTTP
jgi:transposase InsO family protein